MTGRTRSTRLPGERLVRIALMTVAIGLAPFVATLTATAEPVDVVDQPTTVIGDRVWNDKDADGEQEIGEGGINGVTVQLLDKRGRALASTVTEGNGNFRFENWQPGTYHVRLLASTLPDGYEMTHDFDGGAAGIARLILRPEHVRLNLDFGYRKVATKSIQDVVWLDANADGDRGSSEPGLANVKVVLLSGGEELDRVPTRSNGYFRFDSVPLGSYKLKVDWTSLPFGVAGAGSNRIQVAAASSSRGFDLGYDHFGIIPLGD